jgi:hypothetical protein
MIKQQFSLKMLIFIVFEIILMILVQLTSGVMNTVVSFTSVVCAFIYGVLYLNKHNILIIIGLFTTVCADIFLVVIEPMKQNIAMTFFSITQIAYFVYICNSQTKRQQRIHFIIRGMVVALSLIIMIIVLKDKTDFLSSISIFYYANLISNIIFAFTIKNKNILLIIGLILFACCDFVIGISIMGESYLSLKEGTLLYFIANPGFNLAWIFYVPSQTLIALSVKKDYTIPN